MLISRVRFGFCAAALLCSALSTAPPAARAQEGAPVRRGQLRDVTVHGPSLERNSAGLSPDRAVSVYLPPSYAQSTTRRYPVIYLLHGIMDSNRTWTEGWDRAHPGFATIQDVMDAGIAAGALQEMIVVAPDADKTCHYTDSVVKGGWTTFVAADLVAYVDKTYRTVASPAGRGLMGHSMGGHGAIKIAMTRPGIFGAVYAMNPSMLGWGGDVSADNPAFATLAAIKSPADLGAAPFYAQAVVGIGQCFSPNPSAPLLTDLPFAPAADGRLQEGPGYGQWTAQMPLNMIGSRAAALKSLRGLRFDSAFEDEFAHIPLTSRAFSAALTQAGVEHAFEMYNGDHRNQLWGRDGRVVNEALPFFSRLLGDVPAAPPTPSASSPEMVMLWDAALAGDLKAVAAAVAKGADVNALDTRTVPNGRRPLNYAAEHNRVELIQWLVDHGADLNRPNSSGFTPLHHAAESGSLEAAMELVRLGANPQARLPSGRTPLDIARQRGHRKVADFLAKIKSPDR